MRIPFTPFLLAACLVVGAGWSDPSLAKPKRTSFGCTMSQIQSPEGTSCVRQLEQDILHNRSTTHVLVCNVTGKFCCKMSGGSVVGCVRASSFGTTNRQPNGTLSTAPGTTKPGGNLGIAPPRRH